MKMIIFLLTMTLSILHAQASNQVLKCEGEVFYSSNNEFQVTVTNGIGSNIEYERDARFAYIPVYVAIDSNSVFKVASSTNEGGSVRMKIDLNAKKGEMISLYETLWEMENDEPYDVLGSCRLLK